MKNSISRKNRGIEPEHGKKRDTHLIIIAVEGTCTEKQYLESDDFKNSRIQVKVLETTEGCSSPKHIQSRISEYAKKMELQKDDQLWLVLDKDNNKANVLDEICNLKIRNYGKPNLAISSPCFELWLYLHLAYWGKEIITSQKMKSALRKKLGSYNSSNLKMENFVEGDGINKAISRAQRMTHREHPKQVFPDNPGTDVYKLVLELYKLMGKKPPSAS